MCFICPFTLQSAERVFRSLHLKCHCINSSLKHHNIQMLADLLGFLMPPWKDKEVLITRTKYFIEKLFIDNLVSYVEPQLNSVQCRDLCKLIQVKEEVYRCWEGCCLCWGLIARKVRRTKRFGWCQKCDFRMSNLKNDPTGSTAKVSSSENHCYW